jgi:hypothetical protein
LNIGRDKSGRTPRDQANKGHSQTVKYMGRRQDTKIEQKCDERIEYRFRCRKQVTMDGLSD